MVDAPLRAYDFRRFSLRLHGRPQNSRKAKRGGGGEGLKAVQGLLGGLFHPWLSSGRLAIRFYYELGKIGPNVY
jgi:hypothetical protein